MEELKIVVLLCIAIGAGQGEAVPPRRQQARLGLIQHLPMPLSRIPPAPAQDLSIGASPAVKGQFPFIVSLQKYGEHFCGGSIISHHTVLTAAHCAQYPTYVYKVVAGDHDLQIKEGTEQYRTVAKLIVHPDFSTFTLVGFSPNDVAVLLLNEPFGFNEYVKPIKLAAPGVIHDGTTVLSGWGFIDAYQRTKPDVLMTEELPVVEHSECVDQIGRQILGLDDNDLPDSMLCTGPLGGGMGPCRGDSGGPLVQNGVLVGVVSWGPRSCGTANFPSGFTRVSAFTEWILAADRQLRARENFRFNTKERHFPPGFPGSTRSRLDRAPDPVPGATV